MAGLLASCMGMEDVDPSSLSMPEVKAFNVKDNGSLVFELSATVDKSVASRIAECGFYYGKDKNLSDANKIECKMLGGSFSADVTLHEYGETFYACSYISNGIEGNEICSDPKKITVKELEEYVEFSDLTVVSYDKATKVASVSISYKVEEGVVVTARGLCYGESKDISVNGNTLKDADLSSESVIYNIPEIETGKTYYVRPYLYDGDELAYGDVSELNVYAVPVVEIGEVSEITSDGATISCEVVDDCGKTIRSRGVVYVKGDGEPTLNTGKSVVTGSSGEYTVILSGLSPNTLYSVRAYAENEKGVAYSSEKRTFTTLVALPAITVSVGDKTSSSATLTGKITSDGGEIPSEVGFYYSQSEDVDPMTSIKVTGITSGSSFTAELNGLTRVTKYYVRAYAVNSAGEALSSSVPFITQAELPVVETADVTEVTDVSAVCGGNVIDDGGSEIAAKGIVWSTSPDPTVSQSINKTDEGKGVGEFSSSMTRLSFSTKYYVRAYATNSAGTSYGETMEFVTAKVNLSNVPDLSSAGTANCYIVSKVGINRFLAVKGNSDVSVGDVKSVEVLWETFGTSRTPKVGDLIKHVSYDEGFVIFQTADIFKEGNAVIAAKDASGTILWSWHIWLTDEPDKCVYANNAGIMMDRNLGATSTTPGDVGALGLLYQWGRKDPFLGSSSIVDEVEAKSTLTWPSPVWVSPSYGTIEYVVSNPTTFIKSDSDYNYDWYCSTDSVIAANRWQSEKTIYDPCPLGWRVPDGGNNGVWAKAGFSSDWSWNDDDDYRHGLLAGSGISSPATWYPIAGCRFRNDSRLSYVGSSGDYWSVTLDGYDVYVFCLMDYVSSGGAYPTSTTGSRATANSVRCLQE